MIKINNLKKIYSNGHEALKGINLNIEKGKFFGLLGPNGAGKTTTIGILTGLVNLTSGSVLVDGLDINKDYKGQTPLQKAQQKGHTKIVTLLQQFSASK